MGKALAERYRPAARAFDEASDALGIDVRALCWDGPDGLLDLTVNAQPAIVTTSVAALRAALDEGLMGASGREAGDVICLGHSVGEYSALVAAGALELGDAVRLVRRRGELMQSVAAGGMAAVLGLDADAITRVIAGTALVVANDNAPGQVVVSGPQGAIEAATGPLKAVGGFEGAGRLQLRRALDAAPWSALRYRVIANVDADVHEHARDFPELLERQVWSPVRWVDSVRVAAAEGAELFIEFGAGNVLTGLAKRILPAPQTASVGNPAGVEEALSLRGR